MTTIYISHEDENKDGITEMLRVYSDNFGGEPLIGDYRGIALHIINGEVANGAMFDSQRGNKFQSYFPMWNTENVLEREA